MRQNFTERGKQMKKTAFFLLLAMLLTSFAACSSNEQPVETTGATTEATTFEPQTNPPPTSNVQHSVKLNEDTTSTKVVVEKSTPKTEEYDLGEQLCQCLLQFEDAW